MLRGPMSNILSLSRIYQGFHVVYAKFWLAQIHNRKHFFLCVCALRDLKSCVCSETLFANFGSNEWVFKLMSLSYKLEAV